MTDSNDEEFFWNITDALINTANNHLEEGDPGIVLSALISAASRFGAFYLASSSESKEGLKEDKDEIIKKLGAEFKRKLADDLDDYINNYKVYIKNDSEA